VAGAHLVVLGAQRQRIALAGCGGRFRRLAHALDKGRALSLARLHPRFVEAQQVARLRRRRQHVEVVGVRWHAVAARSLGSGWRRGGGEQCPTSRKKLHAPATRLQAHK